MELLKHLALGLGIVIGLALISAFVVVLFLGMVVVGETYGALGGIAWGLALFATFIGVVNYASDHRGY